MDKVAILVDGGYFLKRLPSLRPEIDMSDADAVARCLDYLVNNHLENLNEIQKANHHYALLYRCFYYDAKPYDGKAHRPVSKTALDYARSAEAKFRNELFEKLKRKRNVALRLGHIIKERSWSMKEEAQKALLAGTKTVAELSDADFAPGLRQKGVDMRIGLDIASITLKKQASTIVLVAGDADFVPAAKLARREGMRFILDPLWRNVAPDLFEHIDGLRSAFARPRPASPSEPD